MVEEKILVVDDSAEVQQQVNEMLSQVGYSKREIVEKFP